MAMNLLTKIFGSRNDRLLKQYRSGVNRINAMEAELEAIRGRYTDKIEYYKQALEAVKRKKL